MSEHDAKSEGEGWTMLDTGDARHAACHEKIIGILKVVEGTDQSMAINLLAVALAWCIADIHGHGGCERLPRIGEIIHNNMHARADHNGDIDCGDGGAIH